MIPAAHPTIAGWKTSRGWTIEAESDPTLTVSTPSSSFRELSSTRRKCSRLQSSILGRRTLKACSGLLTSGGRFPRYRRRFSSATYIGDSFLTKEERARKRVAGEPGWLKVQMEKAAASIERSTSCPALYDVDVSACRRPP